MTTQNFLLLFLSLHCFLFITINVDCSSSANNNQTFIISNNQQVLFQVDGRNQTVSINNSKLLVDGIDVNAVLDLILNRPMIICANNATQAISSTPSAILFDLEVFESHSSMHNSNFSSRFYAPIAGIYQVSGEIPWEFTTSASYRYLTLWKNEQAVRELAGTLINQYGYPVVPYIETIRLNAGEYISIYAKTDYGGTIQSSTLSAATLTMTWMRP